MRPRFKQKTLTPTFVLLTVLLSATLAGCVKQPDDDFIGSECRSDAVEEPTITVLHDEHEPSPLEVQVANQDDTAEIRASLTKFRIVDGNGTAWQADTSDSNFPARATIGPGENVRGWVYFDIDQETQGPYNLKYDYDATTDARCPDPSSEDPELTILDAETAPFIIDNVRLTNTGTDDLRVSATGFRIVDDNSTAWQAEPGSRGGFPNTATIGPGESVEGHVDFTGIYRETIPDPYTLRYSYVRVQAEASVPASS